MGKRKKASYSASKALCALKERAAADGLLKYPLRVVQAADIAIEALRDGKADEAAWWAMTATEDFWEQRYNSFAKGAIETWRHHWGPAEEKAAQLGELRVGQAQRSAVARKAKSTKTEERHQKIREAVTQRLLAHPHDSVAYAGQCVASEHRDAQGHPLPGWSDESIKRATKGMKPPPRKRKSTRR